MNLEDLQGIIHSDPEVMGGTPVFSGTRVPLQNLIEALEGGESIGVKSSPFDLSLGNPNETCGLNR